VEENSPEKPERIKKPVMKLNIKKQGLRGRPNREMNLLVQLDLGCGKKKRKDHIGLDIAKSKDVNILCDLSFSVPLKSNSVDRVYSNHFLEHIDPPRHRVLFNEIVRVCKNDAIVTFTVPYWSYEAAMFDEHRCTLPQEFFNQLERYKDHWFDQEGYFHIEKFDYNFTKEGLDFCKKLGITPEEGLKFLNNIACEMTVTIKVIKNV